MYVQIFKLFTERPIRSAVIIPDFDPELSDSDDVFPEDVEYRIDPVAVLIADQPAGLATDLDDEAIGGLTFAMEYRDSKNAVSRRRVTINGFRESNDGNYLMRAFCHERKAVRSFRTDRIVSVIDWDGVIWEPVDSFGDLGIDLPLPVSGMAISRSTEAKAGEVQREVCADELCILAALSQSDGQLDDLEVEQILDFSADVCDRKGIGFQESDRSALDRYIRRLRPDIHAIAESLLRLKVRNDPESDKRLVRAMIAVMDADERQSPEELAFISEVLNELSV
ncbi:WYL domain-containing protein [Pelagibius sp. CAU 1746]|uniref:tellurite resistance TerB family protein n=1 Tax=Pelagibius sp. CAU 1746 TaxID=3140370 RepID=UPI00325AEC85